MLESRAAHHYVVCSCKVHQTFTVSTMVTESELPHDLVLSVINWTCAGVPLPCNHSNVACRHSVNVVLPVGEEVVFHRVICV